MGIVEKMAQGSGKLKLLPLQVIELAEGMVLKRGCTEFKVIGEGAAPAMYRILSTLSESGATAETLCQRFAKPDREIVKSLIDKLVERRLLVPTEADETITTINEPENHLDIFYWHFHAVTPNVTEQLNRACIQILGVNYISRQLAQVLLESGVHTCEIIDHPYLRNIRMFNEAGSLKPECWPKTLPQPQILKDWAEEVDSQEFLCLVATSDFGDQQVLREWNRFCQERDCIFFPVVLKNVVGYLGPLVVPGETACFECLHARQNANLREPQTQQAITASAFAGQLVNGFHPAMPSILGDLAAFELTKFFSRILPNQNVGTLIEVNLLASQLSTHKVLKVPRCSVCSPLHTVSAISSMRHSLKENDWNGT